MLWWTLNYDATVDYASYWLVCNPRTQASYWLVCAVYRSNPSVVAFYSCTAIPLKNPIY